MSNISMGQFKDFADYVRREFETNIETDEEKGFLDCPDVQHSEAFEWLVGMIERYATENDADGYAVYQFGLWTQNMYDDLVDAEYERDHQ
jgi:hypothetical protein